MIKKILLILLLPAINYAQNLTNSSSLNITKTWSQEPSGYTYQVQVKMPTSSMPTGGFPVCVVLHGNGGNGNGAVAQFSTILNCHVLIGITGYQNSWNICNENSDAPDLEMIDELINSVQGYTNINSNKIRILGSSNGAGLANRIFIENTNTGIDAICAIVSHLNEPQYHSNNFHMPSGATNSSNSYCGYNVIANPLSTRKYLNISNTNDPIIPYNGGPSNVGVDFLSAEFATYVIAKNQGFTGNQLTTGTTFGNPEITEFSYLSGKVVHIRGYAAHGTNSTQKSYITNFFSDCNTTLGIQETKLNLIKIYPNPTNGIFKIERKSANSTRYSIYNLLNQKIISGICTSKILSIDLSNFTSHVYFLNIDNQLHKVIVN